MIHGYYYHGDRDIAFHKKLEKVLIAISLETIGNKRMWVVHIATSDHAMRDLHPICDKCLKVNWHDILQILTNIW